MSRAERKKPGERQKDLAEVDRLMRAVSLESDPQRLVLMYGEAVERMYPIDLYIALSRRGLEPPYFRITRNSRWAEDVDPWAQRDRLPILSGGQLGEWMYADKPLVLQDFRVDDTDPHADLLKDVRSAVVIPHYDDGKAINVSVMMWDEPGMVDEPDVPGLLWRMNLFGRTTRNLVLRKELGEALGALDKELQVVGEIQRSLLPQELPRIKGLDLAAHYRTSQRAGGDYYDIFQLTEDRWGLFIADVSGHGTPAAVVMAVTHAIAHSHPNSPEPADDVLSRLNRTLFRGYTHGNGTFVTAFYGVYDTRTGVLKYSSAGHNPPRLARTGRVIPLDQGRSLPLGVLEDAEYTSAEIGLEPGDGLLLYTDGITEAKNLRRQLFGEEGLDRAVLASSGAEDMLRRIGEAVDRHAEGVPAADDQTLLGAWVRREPGA